MRTETFRSLKVRNYRLYASGQAISLTGRWMFMTGQDWLVVRLGGHGVALGTVVALQFLPTLLLTPYGGLLADRHDKRRIIQITQGFYAVVAALQAITVITDTASITTVCLFALCVGTFSAIDTPARQSFVIEMVGRADLTNATALNSVTFNLARIVGPALAGLLIATVGEGLVFSLTAASMAGVIVALSRMDTSLLHRAPLVARSKGQVREGLRYLMGRPDLLLVIGLMAVVSALGLNFPITLALMARQEFHGGAESYGLLSSSLAVGSLAGAVMATRRTGSRTRPLMLGALGFGVAETVAACMPTYAAFAVSLLFVGAAILTFTTSCQAIMQTSVQGPVRGRVMSFYLMVFFGTTPLGSPVVGWICEQWGPRAGLAIGGVASILAVAAAAWWLRKHPLQTTAASLQEVAATPESSAVVAA